MLRIFFCLLFVAGFGVLGRCFAYKDRRRKEFYSQWERFNERFLSELSVRLPLTDFLKKYEYEGEFAFFLRCFEESLRSGTLEYELKLLSEDEQEELLRYFLALGKSDAVTQRGFAEGYVPTLRDKRTTLTARAASTEALYTKLGVLCGLLIVVLIL
ncbi:MAG: hypothetical protein ACI4U2_01190 [Christensenellaceae bacterium]